jgi:hypothetical protein
MKTAPAIKRVAWENKRTGRVEMVPEGIDPGWDTNPGKARQRNMQRFLEGKLDGIAPDLAAVARRDLDAYRKAANA